MCVCVCLSVCLCVCLSVICPLLSPSLVMSSTLVVREDEKRSRCVRKSSYLQGLRVLGKNNDLHFPQAAVTMIPQPPTNHREHDGCRLVTRVSKLTSAECWKCNAFCSLLACLFQALFDSWLHFLEWSELKWCGPPSLRSSKIECVGVWVCVSVCVFVCFACVCACVGAFVCVSHSKSIC